jgi:putative transposase
MIDRAHKLPIKRQAEVLSISRGAAYYEPRPAPERDLLLMRKIDELHLNYPFAGSRMLRDLLRQQGLDVGRLRIGTLMKKMGIEAIYRRPNTSKPAPGHRIYPYLMQIVVAIPLESVPEAVRASVVFSNRRMSLSGRFDSSTR